MQRTRKRQKAGSAPPQTGQEKAPAVRVPRLKLGPLNEGGQVQVTLQVSHAFRDSWTTLGPAVLSSARLVHEEVFQDKCAFPPGEETTALETRNAFIRRILTGFCTDEFVMRSAMGAPEGSGLRCVWHGRNLGLEPALLNGMPNSLAQAAKTFAELVACRQSEPAFLGVEKILLQGGISLVLCLPSAIFGVQVTFTDVVAQFFEHWGGPAYPRLR